ncbi:unnamed protein product, partial [Discosporangium mesarthrocarpum]
TFYVDGVVLHKSSKACRADLPGPTSTGESGAIVIGARLRDEAWVKAQTAAPILRVDDNLESCFWGDIGQVRIWSSLCSEAVVQHQVGRRGAMETDAALVCLWKIDEGEAGLIRNARPLQPPKAPRGAKAGDRTAPGAWGHAELWGAWEWVPCFDPSSLPEQGSGAVAVLPAGARDGDRPEVGMGQERAGAVAGDGAGVGAGPEPGQERVREKEAVACAPVLEALAKVVDGERSSLSVREAMLGVLGHLFRQCSLYLLPCAGDPQRERLSTSRWELSQQRADLD